MRYHFIPIRIATVKKGDSNKSWRGYGETWNAHHYGDEDIATLGNTLTVS